MGLTVSSTQTLLEIPLFQPAIVHSFSLDSSIESAVRAMGLELGRSVLVLRRAAFGGPLHLRLHWATEIAIDRAVAAGVNVTFAPSAEAGNYRENS